MITSTFKAFGLGICAIALTAGSFALAIEGCSTSHTPAACTQSALKITFSPMYSAVIPGDETHRFQIPVIVSGASQSGVVWSASDPSAVSVEPDALTGGALLTMLSSAKNPGAPVTITATAVSTSGTAVLNITTATEDDWNAGEARYNDRIGPDAGPRAACTDCHSPTATAGAGFNDIAHTPEQAGGFSDQEILNIVQKGQIPDGGYFDPSIVSYKTWQSFHQWNLTDPEQKGIVIYLRSLVPTAQGGTANFGGAGSAPDGG